MAAAGGFERLHGSLDVGDADLWRLLRRERVETVQLLAAAGEAGARRWLDHVRHRKLSISGDDLVAAGPQGRRRGRGPVARDGGDARGPRRPTASRSCARQYPLSREFPLGGRPDRRRPAARAGGLLDGPRRRVRAARSTSLNLGLLTDDAPENVAENRRRLGEFVGHPWPRFCYGRQVHGTTVRRATEPPSAERPYTEEDGQATALDDAAAIVFVADCLPVLLAARGGVAALHCGWRPLAGGIVDEGVRALREVGGDGPITAALGPSARGCCYEVGEEVHAHFAAYDARRGERNLDLAAVAPRSSSQAHGIEVSRRRAVHDLRRALLLAPPRPGRHRPPGGGRVPRLISGLDAARIHANLERVRSAIADAGRDPAEVELLAAVKYVPLEELGVLGEAGLTLLGENRAQDLEAKADAAPRVPLALHRPAAVAQGQADRAARGADPLGRVGVRAAPARDATAGRRRRSCSRSTSPGEEGKAGIAPSELPRYLERLAGRGRRADDDAAVRRQIPRPAARISRGCASSPTQHGLQASCRWARPRTTPSLQPKVQRLCGSARRSIRRVSRETLPCHERLTRLCP